MRRRGRGRGGGAERGCEADLSLCSENEELEELASADLKYLLVPALLGALTLRQVEPSRRREHLESARRHFCR